MLLFFVIVKMSILTRHRTKFEDNEKKKWIAEYNEYIDKLEMKPSSPSDYFKKRRLTRPSIITLKKIPEYKSPLSYGNKAVIHFLEMALVFMINSENIQSWFFDEEYIGYFFAEFQSGDRAHHLVLRLIERLQNPDLVREPVDDFIDQIGDPIRLINLNKEKLPDTLKFSLHILSLEGPVQERLLLNSSPSEIEAYINTVVGKQVFVEGEGDTGDTGEADTGEGDRDFVEGFVEADRGLVEGFVEADRGLVEGFVEADRGLVEGFVEADRGFVEGLTEVISLIDDEDEEDVSQGLRKRHYDEIIDLTYSDDEAV